MQIALRSQTATQPGTTARHGATLVEVLMSLLIFSIGIVSVFTLFPVSLLSSIQATKLTNSKILGDNVVEIIRTNPEMLVPPCPTTNPDRGFWQPRFQYTVNDCARPTLKPGELFALPSRVYRCALIDPMNPPPNPKTGSIEPNWPSSGTIQDGDFKWTTLTSSNLDDYVIDPLGMALIPVPSGKPDFFGYNKAANVGGPGKIVRRLTGGLTDFQDQAIPLFTQPDTWSLVFEEVPSAIEDSTSVTSVTFPSVVDLTRVTALNHRMTIISADRKKSVTKKLAATGTVNIQTLNLVNVDDNDLPNDLDEIDEISKVRVEVFNPRYSYFLTVRRTDPNVAPKLSAALIFNRSFSFKDEEVYDANFGNQAYDDDPEIDGSAPSNLGVDQLRISWKTNNKLAPLLREGNYVLDARELIWYRMTNIAIDKTNKRADITLDRSVEVQTVNKTGMETVAEKIGRAVLMPGIVKIIEL